MSGSRAPLAVLLAATALLAGCARVVVSEGGQETGLRVDPPRPYLLVTSPASPPGLPPSRRTAELVLLPDLDRPQWVRVRPGLGTVSARVTLAHGMLAAYEEDVDGEAPDTLAAVGKALAGALGPLEARRVAAAATNDALATSTELFEIQARDDGALDLVAVPPERADRLLARVRAAPATERVRLGP